MSENENPTPEKASGDMSEEDLKKILGDDYDAVVGKAGEAPEAAPGSGSGGTTDSAADPAAAGASGGGDGDPRGVSGEDLGDDLLVGVPGAGSAPAAGGDPAAAPWAVRPEEEAAVGEAVRAVHFGQLDDHGERQPGSLDVLLDVKLPISVELGRTEMLVKEILECGPGTVIELNKLAGEPVDVFVNGRMVAQGEVVVVDEHFGVRVNSLLSPRERVRSLA